MPRIVSGVREDFQDPGLAFLAGAEHATQRGKEQRAAQMESLRLGLAIQKAQADYEEQKAKALADVNARVQMGDVQAMIQQAREAELANRPVEEKLLERAIAMGPTLEPKAREANDEFLRGAFGSLKRQKEDAALQTGVERLRAKGLLPEAKEGEVDPFTLRRQGGEAVDTLLSDMAKMEQEQTLANMAMQKNTDAIAQLDQLVASSPDSDGKLMAQYRLQALKDDPTALTKPGSAAEVGRFVQQDLLKGQNQLDKEQLTRQKAIAARQAEHRKLLRGDKEARLAFAEKREASGDEMDFGPGAFAQSMAEIGNLGKGRAGRKEAAQSALDPGRGPMVSKKAAEVKAEKERRYPGNQPGLGPFLPREQAAPMDTAAPQVATAPAALTPADIRAQLEAQGLPMTPENVRALRDAAGR